MQLRILKEPDFVGVTAGQRATAKVNTRGNLHMLLLRLLDSSSAALTVAQMKAACGDLTLKIDGRIVRDVDVTHLLEIQKYYGDIALGGNVDGIVAINFQRPLLRDFLERAVNSLGLGNVDSVTIEVAITSTAVLSKIELHSVVDDLPLRNLGDHIQVHRFSRSFSSTGVQELTDLPISDDQAKAYLAAHIRHTTGTLSKVRFRKDGVDVFDNLTADIAQVMQNYAQRTPQSNYRHLEFDLAGNLVSVLVMPAKSLFCELTWASAAPNSYYVYLERIFRDPKAR